MLTINSTSENVIQHVVNDILENENDLLNNFVDWETVEEAITSEQETITLYFNEESEFKNLNVNIFYGVNNIIHYEID